MEQMPNDPAEVAHHEPDGAIAGTDPIGSSAKLNDFVGDISDHRRKHTACSLLNRESRGRAVAPWESLTVIVTVDMPSAREATD